MKVVASAKKLAVPAILLVGCALSCSVSNSNLVDRYVELVVMYVGINFILTLSLNLVNGYMGEFSVGHAVFMAIGAYTSAIITVKVFSLSLGPWIFPLAVLTGGMASALAGLLVAIPSFKIRGDYLAIVTLAFNMIVKSIIENVDFLGGPRGYLGIAKLTSLVWVFFFSFMALWVIRNFVYSNYGRGVVSIREDETAAIIMGVDTKKVKIMTFMLSSFFAGVAGALYAHLLQFISPKSFDILKSTEILIMVYLGGIGSIAGSVLGASVYTVLLELLRPLGIWRMVIMPLVLVFLMIFRPKGITGLREFKWFIPSAEKKIKLFKHKV
ncbi:MAG: branched-chain amino acid ABC transporter permease [Nitrospirae bacterium]|nr:branched-chain amino acid ABC transporter permease [Nitrospirota bacterium]